MSKIYVDRFDGAKGHTGVMSIRDSDGRWVFEKLRFRTGLAGYGSTDWIVGKSPIPTLEASGRRVYYVHLQHVNKNNEASPISRKPNGIGWFWPISSSPTDPWTISDTDSSGKRTFIGIHAENAFDGTNGCVGLRHDGKGDGRNLAEERAAVIGVNAWLDEMRSQGVKTIEMWVG
jgi:hypothetical protein